MYLLDSDTCIDIIRGQKNVLERLRGKDPDLCYLSTITTFELFAGVVKPDASHTGRERTMHLLGELSELTFDHEDARVAAEIRADLRARGATIGPYDLLIAGQAIARGFTLVTSNAREFQRVQGLTFESWRV